MSFRRSPSAQLRINSATEESKILSNLILIGQHYSDAIFNIIRHHEAHVPLDFRPLADPDLSGLSSAEGLGVTYEIGCLYP